MLGFDEFIKAIQEEEDETNEALTFAGRRKKAIAMRRNKQKLQRQKKVALKRAATFDRLKKRSDRTARGDTIKKVSGGQTKASMSIAAKSRAEKRASSSVYAKRTAVAAKKGIHKKRALDIKRRK